MFAATCYSDMDKRWIILYDGYCNLCSSAVKWIVRNDRKRRFTFVPLQHASGWEEFRTAHPDKVIGSTGSREMSASMQDKLRRERLKKGVHSEVIPSVNPDVPPVSPDLRPVERFSEDTVLLWREGKLYSRSTAVIRIAIKLRFPWPVLGIFLLVPGFIRDPLYNLVARNRVRWFGRRHSCYLP
ncbi:MAG: thiol-disulfide oxidoreductase DCC family protein [Bacteroidales bacterium]